MSFFFVCDLPVFLFCLFCFFNLAAFNILLKKVSLCFNYHLLWAIFSPEFVYLVLCVLYLYGYLSLA